MEFFFGRIYIVCRFKQLLLTVSSWIWYSLQSAHPTAHVVNLHLSNPQKKHGDEKVDTDSEKKCAETPRIIIHADSTLMCILYYSDFGHLMFMWPVGGKSPLFPRTFDGLDICFQVGWPASICNIDGSMKKVYKSDIVPKKTSVAGHHFWKWLHWKLAEKKVGNLNSTGSQSFLTSQVQLMVALWKLSSTRWLGKNILGRRVLMFIDHTKTHVLFGFQYDLNRKNSSHFWTFVFFEFGDSGIHQLFYLVCGVAPSVAQKQFKMKLPEKQRGLCIESLGIKSRTFLGQFYS